MSDQTILTEREFNQLQKNKWDGKEFARRVCNGCNSVRGIQRPLREEDVNKVDYIGSTINVHYDRGGFSVNAALIIAIEDDEASYKRKTYLTRQIRCRLNFGGSERDIATTIAVMALQRELLEIAAEIESAFNRTYLVENTNE